MNHVPNEKRKQHDRNLAYLVGDTPFGLSWEEWTTKWWQ
jgi:hypothetical protein